MRPRLKLLLCGAAKAWNRVPLMGIAAGIVCAVGLFGCGPGPCKDLREGDVLVFELESYGEPNASADVCDYAALGFAPGTTIRMTVESFVRGPGLRCFPATGTVSSDGGWSYVSDSTGDLGYFTARTRANQFGCTGALSLDGPANLAADTLDAGSDDRFDRALSEVPIVAAFHIAYAPAGFNQSAECPEKCFGALLGKLHLERSGS